MQFLYPNFLWALGALAIPIIIHLFYFRRFKKVYFTNVQFLKEVKEETSIRSRLRNLLVLLMRLLALALLVFAFAQPFIPLDDAEVKQGRKAVSIFIDNSFSMESVNAEVPLLTKAKERATEIVDAFPVDADIQILTNDFEGRHQRLYSKEDALNLIQEVAISPKVKPLSKVLSRQEESLGSSTALVKTRYLISDFQENITDITANTQDTSIATYLLPLQAAQERNVAIDSVWFESPIQMADQVSTMMVRIHNYTNDDVENVDLSMSYLGQNKPLGVMTIPGQSYVVDTVNLTILQTGWQEVSLQITDYPVNFDDTYFITFNVPEQIKVLNLHSGTPNRFLTAAYEGMPRFELESVGVNALDYSTLATYNMVIVDEAPTVSSGLSFALSEYVQNGGNVLFFPSANGDLMAYRRFLLEMQADELQVYQTKERKASQINTQDFVFSDVFDKKTNTSNLKLPVTQGNFSIIAKQRNSGQPLLSYRDGSKLLVKYTNGNGHFYLSAAPLNDEQNDLVRNGEIFIPMLYKMAISAGDNQPLAFTIGNEEQFAANHKATGTELIYKIKGHGEEFIPQQRIVGSRVLFTVNDEIQQAGFAQLFIDPTQVKNNFAFNYDRRESNLAYKSLATLKEDVGNAYTVIDVADETGLTQTIQEANQGTVLWRYCLVGALLFLLIEVLLLRIWKV